MLHKQFDCIVLGGGLIGLTAALALSKLGLNIAVVERNPLEKLRQSSGDQRTTAISASGKVMLDNLGIWDSLKANAEPILDIRVSEKNTKGFVHYSHVDADNEPMGYIIENEIIKKTLIESNQALANVSLIFGKSVSGFSNGQAAIQIDLSDHNMINGSLLIAADGENSHIRTLTGLKTTKIDYKQTSIVFTVNHTLPHNGVAHERFLPGGPIAFLPMTKQRSSVVWTEKTSIANELTNLDTDDFLRGASIRIDDCLGKLSLIGSWATYPLSLTYAEDIIEDRLVLIGDAAHRIHPIAGQGLNLGLRDIAHLVDKLAQAQHTGIDVGSYEVLRRFQSSRLVDNMSLIAATDGLNRLFSNDSRMIKLLRGVGLSGVNMAGPLKTLFMRAAMGHLGQLPSLLEGARPTPSLNLNGLIR
ncbi:MAG: hypothetical protein CMM24_07850 [Rhodospirillaceae bacterium]|nr:hypothetical protein [Rhodospirillaceae bacterium]